MAADVGDRSVISAVLLPKPEDAEALIYCSEAISDMTQSAIRLGAQSPPHITVVQFFAEAEKAARLWQEIQYLHDRVSAVTSTGLCFLPERSRNNTWVELSLFRSDAISKLQAAILTTEFAQHFEVNNGQGDSYRPHVTLAMMAGRRSIDLDLSQFTIFRHTFEDLRLAVGINGDNLSLQSIVGQ